MVRSFSRPGLATTCGLAHSVSEGTELYTLPVRSFFASRVPPAGRNLLLSGRLHNNVASLGSSFILVGCRSHGASLDCHVRGTPAPHPDADNNRSPVCRRCRGLVPGALAL